MSQSDSVDNQYTINSGVLQPPASLGRHNVARKLQKRSLLIAVNALAGLSILFFGYDQ